MIRPKTFEYFDLVKSCKIILNLYQDKLNAIKKQIEFISNKKNTSGYEKAKNIEKLIDLKIKKGQIINDILIKKSTLKELELRAEQQEKLLNSELKTAIDKLDIVIEEIKNYIKTSKNDHYKNKAKLLLKEDFRDMDDYQFVMYYRRLNNILSST